MKKLLCLCLCVLLLCGAMPVTTYAFTENYCDVFGDAAYDLSDIIYYGGGKYEENYGDFSVDAASMMQYSISLWISEEYLVEQNEDHFVYHIPEEVLEAAVKTYFYVEDMDDFKKPLEGGAYNWHSNYDSERKCYVYSYNLFAFGGAWTYYMYGYVREGDLYAIYGCDAIRGTEDDLADGNNKDFVYTGEFLLNGSKEIAVVEQYTKFVVSYDNGIVKFHSREIIDSIPDTVDMITPPTPGDTDGDGKVNIRDLGLLQQHLNGWDVDIHTSACDVNGDRKANIRDLGLLQQHLNGWDVELI